MTRVSGEGNGYPTFKCGKCKFSGPIGLAYFRNKLRFIEKSEADVIREIYEQYVRGASLKEIAERLTSEKVPYSEKMTDWGKARVARIIENTKYLGDEMYDKIVDVSNDFQARRTFR